MGQDPQPRVAGERRRDPHTATGTVIGRLSAQHRAVDFRDAALARLLAPHGAVER